MPKIFVNGKDLSQYGLWANQPLGFADSPVIEFDTTPIPGVAGGIMLTEEAGLRTRELSVSGTLISDSITDAHTKWDEIKRIISGPISEVSFDTWPDRIAQCRLRSATWAPVTGIEKGAGIRLAFEMINPYLYYPSPDVYTIPPGVDVPLELGTAPSNVSLVLIGQGSPDPAVYYKDGQGTIRGSLQYNLTLAQGQWIHFDGETWVSYWRQTVAAAAVNAGPQVKAETRMFSADPNDGVDGRGPSLLAINCYASAYVRKAWL